MKKVAFFMGLIAALLGTLWLLQGLALVHMQPLLCFAECDAVQGPSMVWAIIGAVLLMAGGAAMIWSLKRRRG